MCGGFFPAARLPAGKVKEKMIGVTLPIPKPFVYQTGKKEKYIQRRGEPAKQRLEYPKQMAAALRETAFDCQVIFQEEKEANRMNAGVFSRWRISAFMPQNF